MDSGKLGTLLGILDERERQKMSEFLQSPYFNRSQAIFQLYRYWMVSVQAGIVLKDGEDLFAEVFPGEEFEPIKLKNIKAALQRKLDDFFVQEAMQNDTSNRALATLQFLNAKSEEKYFPYYFEKAQSQISDLNLDRAHLELIQFQFQTEQYEYESRQAHRQGIENAGKTHQHLQNFFLLETLKYLVRRENQAAILGERVQESKSDEIVRLLGDSVDLPESRLFLLLLNVFRNPESQSHYDALHSQLQQASELAAVADLREIYTGALNHCIRRINRGNMEYQTEMLALYKEMDRLGLFLHNNQIYAAQLKNIVSLGLRCGDFDWVQAMIDRYGACVADDPQGNASAFNQGLLYFFQHDYIGAERYLNKVLESYDDVFYGLDARAYLLRVHYETGNVLGMESLAESFKMFLKRNKKVPKAHKESYLLATKYFRRLIKIPNYDQSRLVALSKEIESQHFASGSKRWLLNKIASLLKG